MAQFASDSFTGTAGTELTAYSSNLVKHPSSFAGILQLSNADRCRKDNNSNEALYYWNGGSPINANYTVSADLVAVSSASSNSSVCGRMSTSANTFYMARYDTATGGWQLFRRVTGTFTQLGSTSSQTFTSGTKNLVLSMNGSSIELYKEGSGVATISATDSNITSAGAAGLRATLAGTDSTSMHIDNFSADDIVATAGSIAFARSFPRAILNF